MTRSVRSVRPTAPPLRWKGRPSAAKSCCGSWTPTLPPVITAPGGYAREGQLLDALDGSFITPQAVPDYVDGAPLASRRGKVHPLGFPALLPRTTFQRRA